MILKIKASDEKLESVNDFIHSALPQNSPETLLNQIDLAVEEIFVNIAHYSGAEEAEISCQLKDIKPCMHCDYCLKNKKCIKVILFQI